jgi:pimeloyl-ACP methyl ester carboxylesterase
MDQFNTERLKNETFTIPLIRLRGREGSPNLLLNSGGPGASGVEFIYWRAEQISAIVGEGFHLVGFDPRGVNSSEPFATAIPMGRCDVHMV